MYNICIYVYIYRSGVMRQARCPLRALSPPAPADPSILNLRTNTSQKCVAVPRRARIGGSWAFVSLNSRFEGTVSPGTFRSSASHSSSRPS